MDVHTDLPITGMCVVSDPNKAPPNYTVVRFCTYLYRRQRLHVVKPILIDYYYQGKMMSRKMGLLGCKRKTKRTFFFFFFFFFGGGIAERRGDNLFTPLASLPSLCYPPPTTPHPNPRCYFLFILIWVHSIARTGCYLQTSQHGPTTNSFEFYFS